MQKRQEEKRENMKNNYDKKFSKAHPDSFKSDNRFFDSFENSSEQYKNEIYDIYFGATFLHRDVTYGDTMGVQATPGQYRNLLKIQEKYGIGISLTLNEMNRPIGMIRNDITKEFVSFVKKYYDDGVRSCTISHVHLMKMGVLQEAFPDMNWKNTVNHCISSTQEMVDYAALGYNTIQLDRKFNRNLNELKKSKKEAERLGVKTCLLIKENCMPECPFKTEHDIWQSGRTLRDLKKTYWDVAGHLSCNSWRTASMTNTIDGLKSFDSGVANPRTGTDIMVHSKEDWDDFADNVDMFKLSGRLNNDYREGEELDLQNRQAFFFEMWNKNDNPEYTNMFEVSSFKEIYENNLAPLFMWLGITTIKNDYPTITNMDKIKQGIANHFWNGEEAKTLCKILKRCKNQCYACHKCDDLFETGDIDSITNWKPLRVGQAGNLSGTTGYEIQT